MPASDQRAADDEIQGDVLPGFRRRADAAFHQRFLFAGVADLSDARRGIAALLGEVSTRSTVDEDGLRPERSGAAYLNVAFTAGGLLRFLGLDRIPPEVQGEPFFQGLAARSVERSLLGAPGRWRIGAPGHGIDVMLNIGSPSRSQVRRLGNDIRRVLDRGFRFHDVLQINAAMLPGSIEPFGFRDGLAGPAVGRRSGPPDQGEGTAQGSVTLPRITATDWSYSAQRSEPKLGARPRGRTVRTTLSGRPILPLEQFVLGTGRHSTPRDCSALWQHGSFMVWLRLQQHVDRFWAACASIAERLTAEWAWTVSKEEAAALLVGRRLDGTPLAIAPLQRDERFSYQLPSGIGADPWGYSCPLGAHARKMNPRSAQALDHAILRRGIPYRRRNEVGLAFVCYQASIEEQYEYLQGKWANSPNEPEQQGSPDAMISEVMRSGEGNIEVPSLAGNGSVPIGVRNTWIEPKGGLYLFVPSLSALTLLAAGGSAANGRRLLLGPP